MPSKEYERFIREARAQLVDDYQYVREMGGKPKDTVDLLIQEMGATDAAEIIAAMVLVHGEWDLRISVDSMKWAKENCFYSAHELNFPGCYYCDQIHPSHMEQIVQEMKSRS